MKLMFARSAGNGPGRIVTAVTLFASCVRRPVRALGRNPLIRVSDRVEALAVLGVFVTALATAPVVIHAATVVNDAGVRTATEQSHTRHSVQAVVVEVSGLPTDFGTPDARVHWREGTGFRTEQVVSTATTRAGDQMTIWLDGSGKVVAAPLTPGDAKLNAIVAASTMWIVFVVCSIAVALLVRRALDRSRDRAWERELNLLAHNDDGWANKRP
jgi:hypothetical protein